MNRQDAIRAAQQVGVAPGDYITLQDQQMINHPHLHPGQTSGQPHVDAWHAQNNGGQY